MDTPRPTTRVHPRHWHETTRALVFAALGGVIGATGTYAFLRPGLAFDRGGEAANGAGSALGSRIADLETRLRRIEIGQSRPR